MASNKKGLIRLRNILTKNPKDKSVGWRYSVNLYSRIDRDDIIEAAQRNSQIPSSYLEQCFDALMQEVQNFVMNGHSIRIPHLGVIGARIRSRGAITKDSLDESYIKQLKFNFRPAPELRRQVNSVFIEVDPWKPEEPEP